MIVPVEMTQVLHTVLERMQQIVKERDVHIRSHAGSGLAEVWADGKCIDKHSRPQDAEATIRRLLGIEEHDAEIIRSLAALVGG